MDVVAGRADAGVGDLLHLIHEVNPTGRELPSEEEARLYGLKAGLQSLLLRRFGEQIVVRAESADARVVSLAHRSAPFDACHAVVSELDEDARSWVRRQLDEGPGGQPEEPGPRLHAGRMPAATGGPAGAHGGGGEPAAGEDDRDLVRQARAALEGYDYEEARVRLLEAFEHSAGGLAAARLLLELLVEHLGADQDALDLEDGLSADSSADHDVRALLAVAAARLAQPDRAQHLLKGTRGPRVGAAHAALAQGALQAGDETAATRWIRKLREGAPDHTELARLEEAREALRGEQRGPLEAALTQTHRTGTEEEAERQAQEILDRWPESRIATQVLHEIEGARTHRESQRLLGSAEEALLRGEVAEARRLHRKAVSRQGPSAAKTDPDELLARIERTEAEERTRGDAARVAAVGKALSGDSRSEALLDYLSLSSGLRSAVREASGTEILDWLEQTGVTGSGARAHASVEAVLALEEACALLDAGRPKAAAAILTTHEKGLRGLARTQEIRDRADSQLAGDRRAAAVEALEGATEAMRRGAAEEAQHLLEGCQLKLLPEKLRARAEALSAQVAEAGTTRMLERRLEEARRTDDFLLARDLVRELADRSSGAEREHCLEEHRRLSETVRKRWHVRVLEGVGPARVIPGWASLPTWEDAPIWLTDDASRVVVCSVLGAWVFVQVLELSSRQVVGGVMLRTPKPLGPMTEHVVEGETLWIFGEGARLLRVSIRDWEIVGFQFFGELLPKDVKLERVVPFPGAGRLWVASRTLDDLEERHHVVDLKAWRLSRSVSVGCLLNRLLGGEEPRMLGTHMNRSGGAIYTATGRLLQELTLRGSLLGGAIHPDGEGLVVLVDALADPDEEDGLSLTVAEVSARGQGGELVALPEGGPEYPNCVVTASDDRLMFALVTAEARKRTLVALRRDVSGLRKGYRARVPAETVLVQDRRARKAALVVLGPDGIDLQLLGRRRPRVDSGSGHPDHKLPRLTAPFYCEGIGSSAPEAVVLALVTRLEDLTGAEKRHWLAEFRRAHEDDPEKLLALVSALRRTGDELDEAEDLLESVLDRHPRHPATAVEWAHRLSRIEEWDEVRRRLEGVDLANLEERHAQHLRHLLGAALAWLGEAGGARSQWEAAADQDDYCELEACLRVVTPLPSPLRSEDWGPDRPLVDQLKGAVLAADAALERGDVERAIQAVDRYAVWRAREAQSFARLAEAYLLLEDDTTWFRKSLALASFCHVHDAAPAARRELPFPGGTWGRWRLDALRDRCAAWLEEG